MIDNGTKKGEHQQRERLNIIRKKTLLQMTQTLGITNESTHSQIRKEIHKRIEKHKH